MAAKNTESSRRPRRPPASTPEARENQMVALAFDLAEEQMANGTASAQVITHYLKLGTMRERLEREKLAQENDLLRAKITSLESQGASKEMYEQALKAMSSYQGRDEMPEDYDED